MSLLTPEAPQSDHDLAAYEERLIQLETDGAKISLVGSPVSATQIVYGAEGAVYQTVPFYTLLDDERVLITVHDTRVVGHEYRFTGLELDVECGNGGYLSFTASDVLPSIQVHN